MKEYLITSVKSETGYLSNMYSSPIDYDGKKFLTCEALFQWLRFPKNPEVQQEIYEARSPMAAKMKALKYKDLLQRENWDESEDDIDRMRLCLKLKFDQHPELKDKLLNTKDGIIIEDVSSRDRESARFWGCVRVNGYWKGRNVLGKLLMELRGDSDIPEANGLKADTSNLNYKPDELRIIFDKIKDPVAVEEITQSFEQFDSLNWDSVFTQPVSQLKNEDFVGEPIKILATVSSIYDAFPVQLEEKRVSVLEMMIQDREGSEIECLRVLNSKKGEKAVGIMQSQEFVIFRGTIISVIDTEFFTSQYYFLLYDIIERVTAEDLIYVDKSFPIDVNQIFLNELQGQGIFNYIKNTVVRELGIKGLESAKELDRAIDFIIYQAFSNGKYQNASMKLHSLIIGSPGSGKKLLTNIAMILNPVSREISAVDGKITPAGMIGNVKARNNRTISKPGYFGLASDGVICIQDFHEIKKNRKAVLESFAKVMEDGEVIDSTSAKTTHIARTAIHLDTNRYSQVYSEGNALKLSDIDIPTNVITRFDYIVDIPADIERQWKVVMDMSSGARTLSSFKSKESVKQWQRILKRIIAYIVSYSPNIEISQDVSDYKVAQLQLLKEEYESKIANINEWQGLFTRLAISIDKYLKAITTTKFPINVCKKSDVDIAIGFIRPKLDFVASLISDIPVNETAEVKRQNLILQVFKGRKFNKNEVTRVLNDKGISVTDKTVSRDLKDLVESGEIVKIKQGQWEIP